MSLFSLELLDQRYVSAARPVAGLAVNSLLEPSGVLLFQLWRLGMMASPQLTDVDAITGSVEGPRRVVPIDGRGGRPGRVHHHAKG